MPHLNKALTLYAINRKMLNLVTYDISDRTLLEKSFDNLREKNKVEIIMASSEKDKVFRQTVDNVKNPNNPNFRF